MGIRPVEADELRMFDELAGLYGTIFNTSGWAALFGGNARLFGIYTPEEKLVGGFTLFREKRFGLSLYRNPPFTPAVGPFLEIRAKNPVSIMDVWKRYLTAMAEFLDSLPYSVLSVSLNDGVVDTQPFIWRQFKVVPEYTYLVDLSLSEDEQLKRMSTLRRNDISRSVKDGLVVKTSEDYEIIKFLVKRTFARQDKEVRGDYLDRILFDYAKDGINAFSCVTYDGSGQPIAGAFSLYDRKRAYYILGGYDHERKHHGGGAIAVWEAMRYAKQLGLQFFDFEGSMVPKIERYFRGFGGRLTPYYRINKAKLPLEVILKFFKREFF